MFDLFSEIGQTLRQNKLRTALTGVSVTWGVFMLIVLLSVTQGLNNNFNEMFSDVNEARISVRSGFTAKPYHGHREGREIQFKQQDMSALTKANPQYVREVSSTIDGLAGTIKAGTNSVQTTYTGVYPQELKNQHVELKWGRPINDRDIESRTKVMILPSSYAEQLFPPDGAKASGSLVTYHDLAFRIVGVYDSRWDRSVYIPFSTAHNMAADKSNIGDLEVNLQNVTTEADGSDAETAVRNTLAQIHDFDPDDSSALWIFNRFQNNLQARSAQDVMLIGVWVLGILTLLTGIVGISNIMFVSVRERTHEIGIRRAIGAKPRNILTQVLAESVAITVIFGYIGIVLGNVVTQIIGHAVSEMDVLKNPSIGLSVAIQVTVVLVISGALAGMLPARRALKIKPVEALRDE